jgi:hypothetical protein
VIPGVTPTATVRRVSDDEPLHVTALGSKRHPNSELARSPRCRERHHAEDPDRAQQQLEHGERGDERI